MSNTSINVHDVRSIRASSVQGGECDPHLTIYWEKLSGQYQASGQITLYLPDAELNRQLIRAINETMARYKEQAQ